MDSVLGLYLLGFIVVSTFFMGFLRGLLIEVKGGFVGIRHIMAGGVLLVVATACSHLQKPSGARTPSQVGEALLMDPKNGTVYDVLFTDPECRRYSYVKETKSTGGYKLANKPKNVYCRNQYDLATSGNRPESPQYQLVELVKAKETRQIFMTYLSFRNKAVKRALCERLQSSDPIPVRLIMSSSEDTTVPDEIKDCNPKMFSYDTRGLEGDLGYAHNKIFMALQTPIDISKTIKGKLDWMSQLARGQRITIVFSSGNMTSGPVMHHENWHFITTDAGTHFAKMHMCVMQSEWDKSSGHTRNGYMKAINDCRKTLVKEGNPQEQDIHAFFVPGEGQNQFENPSLLDNGAEGESASNHMVFGDGVYPGIRQADKIWIGAHRFFYSRMIRELKRRMNSSKPPELRITVDDDTYYKYIDPSHAGDTHAQEWINIEDLVNHGGQVRLMETNEQEHQLHHSKYLIFFKGNKPSALLCGAANLTGAGFTKNWENIYYINIDHVVKAFADHYEKFWSEDGSKFKQTAPVGLQSKASPVELLPTQGAVVDRLDQEGQ